MNYQLSVFTLLITLSIVFVSQGQEITFEQTVWEKIYYLEGERISPNDINKLTEPYPLAQEHMQKARSTRSSATAVGVIGGGLLGWGLGSLIFSREPSYVTLGIGAFMTLVTFPIANTSKRHVHRAVEIYNDAQAVGFETQRNTNITFSVTGNGIGLTLQF
jgi:hypothetical protein